MSNDHEDSPDHIYQSPQGIAITASSASEDILSQSTRMTSSPNNTVTSSAQSHPNLLIPVPIASMSGALAPNSTSTTNTSGSEHVSGVSIHSGESMSTTTTTSHSNGTRSSTSGYSRPRSRLSDSPEAQFGTIRLPYDVCTSIFDQVTRQSDRLSLMLVSDTFLAIGIERLWSRLNFPSLKQWVGMHQTLTFPMPTLVDYSEYIKVLDAADIVPPPDENYVKIFKDILSYSYGRNMHTLIVAGLDIAHDLLSFIIHLHETRPSSASNSHESSTLPGGAGLPMVPEAESATLSRFSLDSGALLLTGPMPSAEQFSSLHPSNDSSQLLLQQSITQLPRTIPFQPHLHKLDISRSATITPSVLSRALSFMTNLKVLIMNNCPAAEDSVLECISSSLLELHICGNPDISDKGVIAIAQRAQRLEVIEWSMPQSVLLSNVITDQSLEMLASCAPNLKKFSFPGLTRLSDSTLQSIAETCHQLESLDVSHCPQISFSATQGLVRKCESLRQMNLDGCSKVFRQVEPLSTSFRTRHEILEALFGGSSLAGATYGMNTSTSLTGHEFERDRRRSSGGRVVYGGMSSENSRSSGMHMSPSRRSFHPGMIHTSTSADARTGPSVFERMRENEGHDVVSPVSVSSGGTLQWPISQDLHESDEPDA